MQTAWHTTIAACILALANLVVFALSQRVNALITTALLLVVVVCVLRMPSQRNLLAALIVMCMVTVIHACSSFHIFDMLNQVQLGLNAGFHSQVSLLNSTQDWEPQYDSSLEHGLPVLFEQVQAAIHTRQSRCDAQNMTVFTVHHFRFGMGAELHWHANILLHVMGLDNALFAWGHEACQSYRGHCREFYEPEHACSDQQLGQMTVMNVTGWLPAPVPPHFLNRLPAGFTHAQIESWWRAQAVGYLVRFNSNTSKRIRDMRAQMHGNLSLAGAINVNIRAGDKIDESILTPTEQIIDRAEALITSLPLSFSRVLFLTSDSAHEIQKAIVYARRKQLHAIYSDVPRMKQGHNQADVAQFWDVNVTIAVLMQLSMTAECDAWIGTRSSNWNRLIDLYRCVHARKCKQAFVEAGDTVVGHYERSPMFWN